MPIGPPRDEDRRRRDDDDDDKPLDDKVEESATVEETPRFKSMWRTRPFPVSAKNMEEFPNKATPGEQMGEGIKESTRETRLCNW